MLEREREAASQEAAAMGERLAAALAEVQLREQSIDDLQKKVHRNFGKLLMILMRRCSCASRA